MPVKSAPSVPIIAVVGRPNVGKSTLFNRLTGRRSALVDDQPGLTRDRRSGEAQLGTATIQLVDTAGLEEAKPGSIAARMRAQTETAIASAHLVLFLIDARDGVTPADRGFAELVRASGKPVILVANKCEGRGGEGGFYEAFELGLGEPVAISAEHGEGIGELMRDAGAALGIAEPPSRKKPRRGEPADAEAPDPAESDLPSRPLRVAIVGRPNAGKSTLVNALLGEERMITGPEPGLTRDTIATDFDWGGRTIRLFDTAGLRRKARISERAEKLAATDALKAIRFAEVVVLLLDAERGMEKQDLTIADMVADEGRALIIAVNKWDLVADKQSRLRSLREEIEQSLAQIKGVPVLALSALSLKGLDQLMRAVLGIDEVWNRRVPTRDLNRWLADAQSRHAAPAVRGRPIRMRYMTQANARPPTFIAFCSRPEGLPKSYVRYLVNGLRDAFNLQGVPIRLQLRKSDNPYAEK